MAVSVNVALEQVSVSPVVVLLSNMLPLVKDSVNVPLPHFMFLVPAPLKLINEALTLLLLTLKSKMHPVVDAVHAPAVMLLTARLALTVIVHVVPPTQVAASRVTSSAELGADAPVAPPDVADHIAVLELSHVHVVVQTAKRAAASACVTQSSAQRRNATRSASAAVLTAAPNTHHR